MHPADLAWIAARQPALDAAIADASRMHVAARQDDPTLAFCVEQTHRELLALSRGADFCYDRPSAALVYALWYHARRVNACLALVGGALAQTTAPAIRVYDLGAGTGAWLWALALAGAAARARGATPPALRLVNVDTSPFMLAHLDRLWHALVVHVPECAHGVTHEAALESWTNPGRTNGATWLAASYLFDHSDKQEPLRDRFRRLVDAYAPERVWLSTAGNKRGLLDDAAAAVRESGYAVETSGTPPFHEALPQAAEAREALGRELGVAFGRPPSWRETSYCGVALVRAESAPALGRALAAPTAAAQQPGRVHLFRPPAQARRRVRLTPSQEAASVHRPRPAHVYGPAGCGKTIVLTERVKNLVEEAGYSTDLRVLVTTFNKELLVLLRSWLGDLLDPNRVQWQVERTAGVQAPVAHAFFGERAAGTPNLSLMHFDVLPTRVGQVGGTIRYDDYHLGKAAEAVAATWARVEAKGLRAADYAHVLDPEFVLEEFHRVYYGHLPRDLDAWTSESYVGFSRPIIRYDIRAGGTPRKILWSQLARYVAACQDEKYLSFTHRRLALLQSLRRGHHAGRFTHVFVDEYQDCTPSDVDVFYHLLTDPNHLVLGGDLAQSVHLGKGGAAPQRNAQCLRWGEGQARFDHLALDGSFRLPFRVADALVPLSAAIKAEHGRGGPAADEILEQAPYKGSPPGARPVVVWAETTAQLAKKVATVFHAYHAYEIDGLTVLDEDRELRVALREAGCPAAESDTVYRIKGLEKTCVVWSTNASPGGRDEVLEHVYTILSRTSRLLVIAVRGEPAAAYQHALSLLAAGPHLLLCWDQPSEQHAATWSLPSAGSTHLTPGEPPGSA